MRKARHHPLKVWIFEYGLTQHEFADLIGISQSHLSDILNGRRKPSLDVVNVMTKVTEGKITSLSFGIQSEN